MQAARKAVETIKETAANIGASAKSGLEKTKATVQEKSERMSASEHNAKMSASAAGHVTEGHPHTTTGPATQTAAGYSTIGDYGSVQPLATNHSSTIPGLGLGHGHGHGNEEVVMGS
jgi:hypothetical protein